MLSVVWLTLTQRLLSFFKSEYVLQLAVACGRLEHNHVGSVVVTSTGLMFIMLRSRFERVKSRNCLGLYSASAWKFFFAIY
jgi:hypothetical protein